MLSKMLSKILHTAADGAMCDKVIYVGVHKTKIPHTDLKILFVKYVASHIFVKYQLLWVFFHIDMTGKGKTN